MFEKIATYLSTHTKTENFAYIHKLYNSGKISLDLRNSTLNFINIYTDDND